jgi:hypothetical protein
MQQCNNATMQHQFCWDFLKPSPLQPPVTPNCQPNHAQLLPESWDRKSVSKVSEGYAEDGIHQPALGEVPTPLARCSLVGPPNGPARGDQARTPRIKQSASAHGGCKKEPLQIPRQQPTYGGDARRNLCKFHGSSLRTVGMQEGTFAANFHTAAAYACCGCEKEISTANYTAAAGLSHTEHTRAGETERGESLQHSSSGPRCKY